VNIPKVPSAIFQRDLKIFQGTPEQLLRRGVIPAAGYPPCPINRRWGAAVVMPAAPCFFVFIPANKKRRNTCVAVFF